MLKLYDLTTEYKREPLGLDEAQPRFGWKLDSDQQDTVQASYRLRIVQGGDVVWDSGTVASTQSVLNEYLGPNLTPRTEYDWTVTVWDNHGETAEGTSRFETGLLNGSAFEGKAQWITHAPDKASPVSPVLYKDFVVQGNVKKARLYATALGMYEAEINGEPVDDTYFHPGWTNYRKRLQYQTCAVTLHSGKNRVALTLANGWYKGKLGFMPQPNHYGDTTAALAALCITYEDGHEEWLGTDGSWLCTTGAVQAAEIYDGETQDFTADPAAPQPARLFDYGFDTLVGQENEPVRCLQRVPVVKEFTAPNGDHLFDFGQNLTGWVEVEIYGDKGQKLTLRHAEALDENGNFTQENFQDRARHKEGGTAQILELVCKEGKNHFKPHFTIMGFRYAKVETDADLNDAVFTAHAVYSDMTVTGTFTCGNNAVNQLVKNSIWSQKGNFCDIPTDCPTRERAGWTGDMGVFIETGLTLMDCYPVVEKWLAECRLNQYPDGRMANIAPPTSRPGYMTPMLCMAAGWGDAAILVPYALYKRTGDRKILADNYEMMQKWYGFLLGRAQQTTEEQQTGAYAKYTVLNGLDYGEWCEPGITPMQAMMNPRKSVGTAYLAYSGRLLAEIAQALGKAEDAAQYRDTAEKAVKAYRAAFTDNGKITSDRQCEYVRAIAFALLGEEESQAAADTLNRMVAENGYHLNTGFLSTPFLCEVLAKYGHADTAYKLLLQDTAPSWLYEVKQGATTVWETWTGIDANGHPSESLNHYSYGAICGWLFGGVCGIRLAGETLTIAPTPNPALGWAKAVYDSPVGRIESGWQYAGDAVTYTITVPCNLTAEVTLPDGRSLTLQPGTHIL